MSKPFIVANRKGLDALPHWIKRQNFNSYSISLTAVPVMFNIGKDDGRRYTRTQGVLVKHGELIEPTENIIRAHLGWPLVGEEE